MVRIVNRALENPADFPLWLRREITAGEGVDSFDREMRGQIEDVFGDLDRETDATGLIESMRETVTSGKATPEQGVSWTLAALDLAEETITHQMDNDWEMQCDLEDLGILAVEFLHRSEQGGKELAETIHALLDCEFVTPLKELKGFRSRLGRDGLSHLRRLQEKSASPDRSILTEIYELQKDESAWIELKLASPSEEDQIAGLERIKTSQSAQKAIERARIHLEIRDGRSGGLRVRQWWYQERNGTGEDPSVIAKDAWDAFERQPCSPDTWNMLEEWSNLDRSWEAVRKRGLSLLSKLETGKIYDNFRHARIRIARGEGRERDAWEIARLGLSPHEMEEAIFLAFPHWPSEALTEFDKLMESRFKGLEATNSQGVYQSFADHLRRGKKPFGADWLAGWKRRVNARFARRPKLLEMVGKV